MFYPQLDIIPVIVQAKSFSKAAKILNLSQPAISGKVQAIEDHYGIKIFQRTTHGVTLTEAGKVVNAYALKLTEMYQAMDFELDQLLNTAKPKIIIGSSCTSGNYAMPCIIHAFKNKYPQVDVKLDIANTERCLAKLQNKELDLAVVDGKVNNPNFIVSYLTSLELVFVTSSHNHRYRRRKEYTLKELLNIPFVMREKGAAMRTILENFLNENGFDIGNCNVASEMNSIQSVKSAVNQGFGVSLVPRIAVQDELHSGIFQPILVSDMDLTVDVHLAYRADEELSPAVRNFINFVIHKGISCWSLKPAI